METDNINPSAKHDRTIKKKQQFGEARSILHTRRIANTGPVQSHLLPFNQQLKDKIYRTYSPYKFFESNGETSLFAVTLPLYVNPNRVDIQ